MICFIASCAAFFHLAWCRFVHAIYHACINHAWLFLQQQLTAFMHSTNITICRVEARRDWCNDPTWRSSGIVSSVCHVYKFSHLLLQKDKDAVKSLPQITAVANERFDQLILQYLACWIEDHISQARECVSASSSGIHCLPAWCPADMRL